MASIKVVVIHMQHSHYYGETRFAGLQSVCVAGLACLFLIIVQLSTPVGLMLQPGRCAGLTARGQQHCVLVKYMFDKEKIFNHHYYYE